MHYYINSDTLLLFPISEGKTKVYELNDTFIINRNTMDILEESCVYFGSSYEGRMSGAKKLLNMKYKLPFILEDTQELVLFPTCSPRLDNCIWLVLKNIENYKRNYKKTTVFFKNNNKIDLDISYGSFENQIFRATMLLMKLKRNKTEQKNDQK